MKLSEFIGKTVKEIVIEKQISDYSFTTLIIFDDGSTCMYFTDDPSFYTPQGDNVETDIEAISFDEFSSKLTKNIAEHSNEI